MDHHKCSMYTKYSRYSNNCKSITNSISSIDYNNELCRWYATNINSNSNFSSRNNNCMV